LDVSNSLGNDNILLFGQPRDLSSDGTKVWLFNMLLGAPGNMMWDSVKALSDGDYAGAVPWPKIIDNFHKAYGQMTEGTVSKRTGEQYAPPTGPLEGVWQGLGFQPASKARDWEGGPASTQKYEKIAFNQKQDLMGRWASLKGREASAFFKGEIAAWNKAHKDRNLKITYDGLLRSKRERQKNQRERERERKK
ncbi:MAG TPA: hypothetical protein VF104_08765, partial [Burkholderiales bacterium]